MHRIKIFSITIVLIFSLAALSWADTSSPWLRGAGSGFHAGTQSMTFSGSLLIDSPLWSGKSIHHSLSLGGSYGIILSDVLAKNHWYAGNLQFRLEFFALEETEHAHDWTVGVTPHLRYYFVTDTPFVPYLDAGVGLCLTEIREPDLGGVFQFNEQVALGISGFFTERAALSLEGRFMHISSANLSRPNRGMNLLGPCMEVSWYF